MLVISNDSRLRGFTLMEVVVSVAILAVLAGIIVVSVEGSSRIGGQAKRVDDAARVLIALRDASVRYNLGGTGRPSFTWEVSPPAPAVVPTSKGVNPGKLSHLTTAILATDLNSCGYAYGATTAANWKSNYYHQPITTGTFRIADGFVADDQLKRYDITGTPNNFTVGDALSPGTLAIVMREVALSDALALADRMEGRPNAGIGSVIRFTANGNAPITVEYHMGVHGC